MPTVVVPFNSLTRNGSEALPLCFWVGLGVQSLPDISLAARGVSALLLSPWWPPVTTGGTGCGGVASLPPSQWWKPWFLMRPSQYHPSREKGEHVSHYFWAGWKTQPSTQPSQIPPWRGVGVLHYSLERVGSRHPTWPFFFFFSRLGVDWDTVLCGIWLEQSSYCPGPSVLLGWPSLVLWLERVNFPGTLSVPVDVAR